MNQMTNHDETQDDKTPHTKTGNNVAKKVTVRKQSQAKRNKHVYIPRVWFEGKKMIIRGKAKLQQSNGEIYRTLQEKANVKRNKEQKATTDNEIRCGSQTTLSNMFSNKKKR